MFKKSGLQIGIFIVALALIHISLFAASDESKATIKVYLNGKRYKGTTYIDRYTCRSGTSISNCVLGPYISDIFGERPPSGCYYPYNCDIFPKFDRLETIGVAINNTVYYIRETPELEFGHTYIFDVTNGKATLREEPWFIANYIGDTYKIAYVLLFLLLVPVLLTFLIKIPILNHKIPTFRLKKKIFVVTSVITSILAYNISVMLNKGEHPDPFIQLFVAIVCVFLETFIFKLVFKKTESDFEIKKFVKNLLLIYFLCFVVTVILREFWSANHYYRIRSRSVYDNSKI